MSAVGKARSMLEEYRTLRSEIHSLQKRSTDLLIYTILATGALLGYGFSVQIGFVFLVPFSVVIPLSYQVKNNADMILLLGTYISVKIEKNIHGLQWETFLCKFREFESKNRKLPRMFECIMIYDLLAMVCLILSFFYWGYPLVSFALIALPLIMYFLWWNYEMPSCYSFKKQQRYIQEIEKAAEILNQEKP